MEVQTSRFGPERFETCLLAKVKPLTPKAMKRLAILVAAFDSRGIAEDVND
jgi:hypothetical protein